MKEYFVHKRFQEKSLVIIDQSITICKEYAAQGFNLSLRQLYYQFVSRDLLANTEANYKKLGSIIADARLAGLLDWSYIEDRGRNIVENSHWDSPKDILEAAARSFRIDLWEDQPNLVLVMIEKQALEGIFEPICSKLDVAFIANKGYTSLSSIYEISQRLRLAKQKGKNIHVLYLGDHDPSGIDMTRDVDDRLSTLSCQDYTVHRLALNMDQVEFYNPPENPTKMSDTRAEKYIQEYGYSSWELDALNPTILAELTTKKIISLRDDDIYKEASQVQEDWKVELLEYANNY